MKEIQGKSILVRVSKGSSYWESALVLPKSHNGTHYGSCSYLAQVYLNYTLVQFKFQVNINKCWKAHTRLVIIQENSQTASYSVQFSQKGPTIFPSRPDAKSARYSFIKRGSCLKVLCLEAKFYCSNLLEQSKWVYLRTCS